MRSLRPEVSEATAAIIERALDLAPGRRFANALEMRTALRIALPATPDVLQAVTAPFYFWLTILPGVTTPLALVCLNLVRSWLGTAPVGLDSWLAMLLGVYTPALLYLYPLLGLYHRAKQAPGPNTGAAVRRARNLLALRLALTIPFWAAITLAVSGGSGLLGAALPLGLLGACLCWCVSIWRAGQTTRPGQRRLSRGSDLVLPAAAQHRSSGL